MISNRAAYELRVLPDGDAYALGLYRAHLGPVLNGTKPFQPLVVLRGVPCKVSLNHVLEALRRSGHRPSQLGRGRGSAFHLTEEDAVRLGLLFLAVKPLRRIDRMEAISERVQRMATEEAFYWFAKVTDPRTGQRAQRALRLLLASD